MSKTVVSCILVLRRGFSHWTTALTLSLTDSPLLLTHSTLSLTHSSHSPLSLTPLSQSFDETIVLLLVPLQSYSLSTSHSLTHPPTHSLTLSARIHYQARRKTSDWHHHQTVCRGGRNLARAILTKHKHCLTMQSKSVCCHSNWSNQTVSYDSV